MMEKPTLYIIIGAPGSGKGTRANEIINEYAIQNKINIEEAKKHFSWQNADFYRGQVSYEKEGIWDEGAQKYSKEAFDRVKEGTITALKNGQSVLHDNTNIANDRREELISSLRKLGLEFRAVPVFMETDIEECKLRNKRRFIEMTDEYEKRKDIDPMTPLPRSVPDEVIERMGKFMTKPTLLEGYNVGDENPKDTRYNALVEFISKKINKKDELEYIPVFNYLNEKLQEDPYANLSIYTKCLNKRKLSPRQMEFMFDMSKKYEAEALFFVKTNFSLDDMKLVDNIFDKLDDKELKKVKSLYKEKDQNINGFLEALKESISDVRYEKITSTDIILEDLSK